MSPERTPLKTTLEELLLKTKPTRILLLRTSIKLALHQSTPLKRLGLLNETDSRRRTQLQSQLVKHLRGVGVDKLLKTETLKLLKAETLKPLKEGTKPRATPLLRDTLFTEIK